MDSAARVSKKPDFAEKYNHLLSSPLCWSVNQLCTFFNNISKNIEEEYKLMRNLKRRKRNYLGQPLPIDKRIKFCDFLEKEANRLELWPRDKTWEDVLGTRFFELLEKVTKHLSFDVVGNLDPNSVCSLMKLIRNCYEHPKVGEKPEVNWCRKMKTESGQWEWKLDEYLFAKFWVTLFPKLPLFVWNAFQSRSDQLQHFYNGNIDISKMNKLSSVLEFVNSLDVACKEQMDEGHLSGRFKMKTEADTHIVELRPLDTNLLGRVLNGSSSSQILVKDNTVSFSWNNNQKESMPYDISSSDQGAAKIESVTYIFTDDFKMEQSCFLDDCTLETEKVVVFLAPDSIEKVVTYFTENEKFTAYPIEWKDISFSAKQSLRISVRDVLEEDGIIYRDILSKLNAKDLNILLRNKKVDLLENYKTPEICKYYTPRRIYNREIVSSSIHSADLSEDILIIVNCSGAKPFKTEKKTKIVNEKDVFPVLNLKDKGCRLFLIEEDILDFYTKIYKFEGCKCNDYNVHFLKSIGNGRLKWLHTHGTISELKPHLGKAAREIGAMKEDEFFSSLKSTSEKHERLLFVADEPGMGKSEILISLSKQLEKDGKIAIVLSLNKLMNHLHRKSVESSVESKENVVLALSELVSGKGLKSELFAELLRNESLSSNLEIMLDGLDEVKSSLFPHAFDAIKALQSELPLARVWVTCREYLLDHVRKRFGRLGHVLEPFSPLEQINFLVNMWSGSMNEKKLDITPEIKSQMVKFAEQCIDKCLSMDYKEIAGIPLQCRMIGEIFVSQVLEKKFNLKQNGYTLCDLYYMFIKRKLEIYINLKKNLGLPMDDEMVKFVLQTTLSNLTKLSLQLLFPDTVSEYKSANEHFHADVSDEGKDILLRHGIVTATDPPVFMHRTIAEFLVARFIVGIVTPRLLQDGNLHNLSEEFRSFLLNDVLEICSIAQFMKNSGDVFREGTLVKFLDMLLAKDPEVKSRAWQRLQPDLNKLAKMIASKSRDSVISHFFTSNKHLDLIGKAGNSRLGNIVKLLINFPDGQLYGLVYGMRMFFECEAIFDLITSVLDPGPNCWHKIPSIDDSQKGLLHHLSDTIFFNRSWLDLADKMCSYIEKVVQLDDSLLEQKNERGRTPLLYLAIILDFSHKKDEFHWKVFTKLVELNADINAVDNENNTVLHFVPFISYERNVKYVVEMGYERANFNIFNSEGLTPLLCALSCTLNVTDDDECDRIQAYIHLGTDLNAIDGKGNSVLLNAIETSAIKIPAIKNLVRHGADVNAVNFHSDTALHLIFNNSICNEEGKNLHECLKQPFDLVTYFVRKGYKVEHFNSFNDEGEIPLTAAFFFIKCFLEKKFVRKHGGNTFLYWDADKSGIIDAEYAEEITEACDYTIDNFLRFGQDINAVDEDGHSVLHNIILMGCGVHFIKSLIKKGANVFHLNKEGLHSAEIALNCKNVEVYNFLRREYPSEFENDSFEWETCSEGSGSSDSEPPK